MGFFDHFTGAALNARWTAVTAGTGTSTVTDSYWQSFVAENADTSFIYLNTLIDKTVSQIFTISIAQTAGTLSRYAWIVNRTSAPVSAALTTFEADARVTLSLATVSAVTAINLAYYDATHTAQVWDTATAAWGTASTLASITPAGQDNYFLLGFEIDGPGARIRMFGFNKDPNGTTYTFEEGYRIFAITDWIAFSSLESTSDSLYLVIGEPYTNAVGATDTTRRVEQVNHYDGTQAYVALNGKTNQADKYDIRIQKGYLDANGLLTFTLPVDRTTVAVSSSVAENTKTPSLLLESGTYWMAYVDGPGVPSGSLWSIRMANATDPASAFTVNGTIVAAVAGGNQAIYHGLYLLKDSADTVKPYKIIVRATDAAVGNATLRVFSSATLPNTSGWTDEGAAVSLGSAGQFDETVVGMGFVYWNPADRLWYLFYDGENASGVVKTSYATSPSLTTLPFTKSGATVIQASATASEALTADLTSGRTVTVASTTGFVPDGLVHIDDSATADNYATARIRKVVSATQLELYEEVVAFTTAASADIDQIDSLGISVHDIALSGSTFYIYTSALGGSSVGGTNVFGEGTGLVSSSTLTGTYTFDFLNSPPFPRTNFGYERSSENPSLVHTPVDTSPALGGGVRLTQARSGVIGYWRAVSEKKKRRL